MDKAGMEPTREGRTGDAIRGAADGAKQEVSRLGDEVKEKSASVFHEQKDMAGRQIKSVANALEAGAGSLENDGQARLAGYTRNAAQRIRQFSDDVEHKDFESAVESVRSYASENPAVVIGGAAVLGLVLSRFLKSSSSRAHELDDEEHIGFAPQTTEPPMDTATGSYEGMASGASTIGEAPRGMHNERRFGDGTER